jgi:hypothetical protein
VAGCGTKKVIESIFIGKSVVNKMSELGFISPSKKIGILGTGSIGSAALSHLRELGHQPYYYDPLFHGTIHHDPFAIPSIDSLINQCDIIIGTTGTDTLKGIAFDRLRGHKIFVSASSADVEFASLLKFAAPTTEPFGVRTIKVHDKFSIDLVNGGFPMNFDRQKDATPGEDIVLTRSLMYVGAMQAVKLIREGNLAGAIHSIDLFCQKKLLQKWIDFKAALGQKPAIKKEDIDGIVEGAETKALSDNSGIWKD